MLTNQLNSAPGLMEHSMTRGEFDKSQYEVVENNNSAIREKIIQSHFGGRNVSCHIGAAMFWVYADTLADVDEVKKVANRLGYKNIKTIEPWTGDPENRQADPKGKYAVDISDSSEMLIGDTAKSFKRLIEPMLKPMEAHITHIYGHMTRMSIDFNNGLVAEMAETSLIEYLGLHKDQVPIAFDVSAEKTQIDIWRVNILAKPKD